MEQIKHQGIVTDVIGQIVKVKITTRSACQQCLIKAQCSLSEQKEKMIEVKTCEAQTYKKGESVLVSLSSDKGLKAVFWGYALPLILILTTVLTLNVCGYSELVCGICSIIVLIPYYFGLFLAKNKLNAMFQFHIEHID